MNDPSLKELLGQDPVVELLQQAVKLKRIAPAYLFLGTSGIGRAKTAKNFIKLIFKVGIDPEKHSLIEKKLASNNHPDLLWVEPTYTHKGELYTVTQAHAQGLAIKTPAKIRIEQIRNLIEFLNRPLLEASRKIVVIEGAETMAETAANALLKTLEEPGKATIILFAPDVDSLLTTLVSRCQRLQFLPLSQTNLIRVLQEQGYQEIIEHPQIMAIAQGSPGKAIAAWQTLQTIPQQLLIRLTKAISTPLEAIELAQIITSELDGQTQLWLVDYLQHYYWQQHQQVQLIQLWEKTRQYLLSYVQPRLVWECALIKLCEN
ncbi:DNA polymerase III, delta prime subunit [Chondrocystis sp. NIES-4102]|nr:DNA polymerase III, delta prime subunit [Chondrocystis sp. NIES-4102]